jgi:hypothetical protein
MYIYQRGYGPETMWSLKEWFAAREYCRQNYSMMKKISNRISGNTIPRI